MVAKMIKSIASKNKEPVQTELRIIEEDAPSFNPFDNIFESDIEDASQPFQLVDADHDSDEDIEI